MPIALYDILRQIAQSGKGIRLLNVYKGVPISYGASVLAIDRESLTVQTDRFQVVCLYREKETFIQGSPLPEILRARVLEMDLPALKVKLGNFSPVRSRVGDRMHVRVQPKNLIQGEILTRDASEPISAELADLSQDGLAIYLGHSAFSARLLAIGADIMITLQLPGSYELPERRTGSLDARKIENPIDRFNRENLRMFHVPAITNPVDGKPSDLQRRATRIPLLELQGTIANSREELSHNRYRLGIRIRTDDPARRFLAQFIAQRQSEIIRELRELSQILEKGNEL